MIRVSFEFMLITLNLRNIVKSMWLLLLYGVEPLLCNDREMSGYTRAVSAQPLGKHVPVAMQQILNYAIVGTQQWNYCVFYVVLAEML
jgi:hypothetical protein